MPGNPKKIVVLGGGHGSSIILSGLKDRNIELTGVITMTDDGGSTGRLRREYGTSAIGDIRNCLSALACDSQKSDLFSYRFSSGELKGHSLGNLFLAAGELLHDDLQQSIDFARRALGVSARILPVTLDKTDLAYKTKNQPVVGMFKIANKPLEREPKLYLTPPAKINNAAKKSLESADLVVVAPGNFYCSIIPSLLVAGVSEALSSSKAKIAIVINLVNTKNHTPNFSVNDYLNELRRLTGKDMIDVVIFNNSQLPRQLLKQGEDQVEPAGIETNKYQVIADDLAASSLNKPDPNDEIGHIRSMLEHDPKKLADILLALV